MGTNKNLLKEIVAKRVFVSGKDEKIIGAQGEERAWMFDFRRAMLEPDVLDIYTDIFFEQFPDPANIQIGGLEVAAIPLIAAIVQKSASRGTPIPGFFIRKSRKKKDLMRAIEGTIHPNKRIVLVDDIINSGNSCLQQIEVLGTGGHAVSELFCILQFRNTEEYVPITSKGVTLTSLFQLNDFSEILPVKNVEHTIDPLPEQPFEVLWRFASPDPNFLYVVPKSAPLLDGGNIYFGSDSGYFWCISQTTGKEIWKFKVLFGAAGKYIFSSPAIVGDMVIFGAYDGNVYSLNKHTGEKVWIYWDADWVGSSPAISTKESAVYIGLEFGLLKKQGAVAALNLKDGKPLWWYEMSGLTHASPAHSPQFNAVFCGCNNGVLYALDAKTGKPLWEVRTGGEIKEGAALNEKRGWIAFGSFDGKVYVRDMRTGEEVTTFQTLTAIYSTPLFIDSLLVVSSTDKHVYCFDVDTKKVVWSFNAASRIFSTPILVGGRIYIGANNGRFYEIDMKTGKNIGALQLSERITNKATYNSEMQTFFIPTVANEIYAVRHTS